MTEIACGPPAHDIGALFDLQHRTSRADQQVAYPIRLERIERAIAMMVAHSDRLCAAMSADFGTRPKAQSIAIDIAATIDSLKAARRHLRRWMRPQRRPVNFPMGWLGVRAEVRHRPLGVVCIIGAWNFPVATVTAPMVGALAAGNRLMLKPSELTPRTAAALATAVAEFFRPDEIAVVIGDAAVGRRLTAMPFDHIVFTGGAATARHIMRAAAENLVPLTLELGGKSPVIVGCGADIARAARQIMFGKLFNAGQICVGPDYVLVRQGWRDALCAELIAATARMLPHMRDNPDYAGIATAQHRHHLQALLADARNQGAYEIVINPAAEAFDENDGKIPPRLLLGVHDGMAVMQQEIFGPVLPILEYGSIEEAIAHVNARPRPLALYYFGHDVLETQQVLDGTVSGGVTINDVLLHAAQEHLPFGGIGASGFGQYRGFDGFRQFSTAQAVLRQSRLNALWGLLRPPYSGFKLRALHAMVRR